MNRHAGCLIVTAEDPQKADGIAVAHLAEMYVHGRLSRRDLEPIKDLLVALVAGELSGHAGPRAPVRVAGDPSRADPVQEAASKLLDAAGAPPDREEERFVRQQFEAWRERGEPIPLEEFDRLFDRIRRRRTVARDVPHVGGCRPCRVQSRFGG